MAGVLGRVTQLSQAVVLRCGLFLGEVPGPAPVSDTAGGHSGCFVSLGTT